MESEDCFTGGFASDTACYGVAFGDEVGDYVGSHEGVCSCDEGVWHLEGYEFGLDMCLLCLHSLNDI